MGPPARPAEAGTGLLPVMRDRLSGATILLDDANRQWEQEILSRWQSELDLNYTLHDSGSRKFAVIQLNGKCSSDTPRLES